jgi:TolB protein
LLPGQRICVGDHGRPGCQRHTLAYVASAVSQETCYQPEHTLDGRSPEGNNEMFAVQTRRGLGVATDVRTGHMGRHGFASAALVVCIASAAAAASSDLKTAELVFSVKTWDGEYSSKDVPGGVETTPAVGAIYRIQTDGRDLKKLVQLGKNTDFPSFSPDGKFIYFQSNASGRSHIYRCSPEGGNVTDLTDGDRIGKRWKDAYGYAFARNGSRLLYTVHDGSTGRMALANVDGSNPRLLFAGLGYTYMGALSPAGDRVVFSGPARGYRLVIADLPEGEPRELTPDHADCYVPQFTPDGKAVIFIRRDGDIYRVGADGKNPLRLTKGNRHVEFRLSANDRHGSTDGPDLSPDGSRIAYIALKDGIPNVCVMDSDGVQQRQITFRNSACGRVRWSPDGKWLAFVSFEGKYSQLFIVAADGGKPRQLTWLDGAVYFINWKP